MGYNIFDDILGWGKGAFTLCQGIKHRAVILGLCRIINSVTVLSNDKIAAQPECGPLSLAVSWGDGGVCVRGEERVYIFLATFRGGQFYFNGKKPNFPSCQVNGFHSHKTSYPEGSTVPAISRVLVVQRKGGRGVSST